MPLVTTTEMFKKAYDGGYAIGAFNVNNMEIIQGIVEAATEEKAPLILQVSAGARKYANTVYLKKMVEAAVETSGLPIALHLDHGDSFALCKDCVDSGFTSVMIDASAHAFAENISITKQVVEYAHDHGVVVEAELGKLAGIEDAVKLNMALRSATRVYSLIAEGYADNFDALYELVRAVPFEDFLPRGAAVNVDAASHRSALFALSAIQRVVKRALCDRMGGTMAESGKTYYLRCVINENRALLLLDTTGESLHKRGYRTYVGDAPIRETLALLMSSSRASSEMPRSSLSTKQLRSLMALSTDWENSRSPLAAIRSPLG